MNIELRDKFFAHIESRGISQNQAAKMLDYSASVLSAYKKGDYAGKVDELESKIAALLEREMSRSTLLNIPAVETAVMKKIFAACDIAYEEKDIAVIVGYAGNGKSFSLEEYGPRRCDTVYYIEADKTTSLHILILRLAERIGVDMKGNGADITRRIINHLQSRDALVVIDQADDLSDGSLEYLRQVVNDKGRTGLVLAGLNKLAAQIQNARNDHDQLLSRVGLYVRLPPVDSGDMGRIIKSVWPRIPQSVETALIENSRIRVRSEQVPSLRRLTKIMKRVHRVNFKNGMDVPTSEIVQEAAQYIMKTDDLI